jgi:hypothetical protein
MDDRRSYSVWGLSLTALASLIVGVTALGIVFFLLILLSRELNHMTLAAGASTLSQNLLQMIVTWPGIGFLLALAGIFAGFSAIPEKGVDNRSQLCKWICGAGISLSLAAIFADMLIISYLRVLASAL